MPTLLTRILPFYVFALIGFLLSRFKVVRSEQATVLSRLLVWVFLPASILRTFSSGCTLPYLRQNALLILCSFAVLAVIALCAHVIVSKAVHDPTERAILTYSAIIPNFSYLGYPMAEALFGPSALIDAMLFALPLSLYTYTIGFRLLSGKPASPRQIFPPPMFALILGVILGISGLGGRMPSVVDTILASAASCMGPMSMILLGIVLSEIPLLALLKDKRIWLMILLRLIVIPLALGLLLSPIGNEALTRCALLIYAMPCGSNTVIFVKNAGGDCRIGAALAMISTMLSLLTVPALMTLLPHLL